MKTRMFAGCLLPSVVLAGQHRDSVQSATTGEYYESRTYSNYRNRAGRWFLGDLS